MSEEAGGFWYHGEGGGRAIKGPSYITALWYQGFYVGPSIEPLLCRESWVSWTVDGNSSSLSCRKLNLMKS